MNRITRILVILMAFCLLFSGCSSTAVTDQAKTETTTLADTETETETEAVTLTSTVSQDEKFGAAKIPMTADEFAEFGFQLGDSVDIRFSNGYEMLDVPYYNGYYVKNTAPVLVAYPGNDFLAITLNNIGVWEEAALQENDTATVTLRERGKYLAIQEALGQSYSFDRDDYESDEQFCNFRALTGGNLKPDYLYRGASPVDNSRGRAACTDALLEATGIAYIVDLADSTEDMLGYLATDSFASDYTATLFGYDNMILLDMSSSFQSEEYHQKVVQGFTGMLDSEGPVYLHCMEGKDRTGFVCLLLEALAGASYEEMRTDYMITYDNYYHVSADKDPEKYDAIAELYFDSFVSYLHGTEDLSELQAADYTDDAIAYLRDGGMSEAQIEQLIAHITVAR